MPEISGRILKTYDRLTLILSYGNPISRPSQQSDFFQVLQEVFVAQIFAHIITVIMDQFLKRQAMRRAGLIGSISDGYNDIQIQWFRVSQNLPEGLLGTDIYPL
jgi:hypothetical protein